MMGHTPNERYVDPNYEPRLGDNQVSLLQKTLLWLTLWLPFSLSLSPHSRTAPAQSQSQVLGRGINTLPPCTHSQCDYCHWGNTMTKERPAMIVSPCLMWPDDGSSLVWRWDPDEMSGVKQQQMRNQQTSAAYGGTLDILVFGCLFTSGNRVVVVLFVFSLNPALWLTQHNTGYSSKVVLKSS